MTIQTTPRSLTLRNVLVLDAVASGGMGALLLLAAGPLAPVLGLPAGLLRGAAVVLVPFAALLLWLAPRAAKLPAVVRTIVAGNVAWVIASLALPLVGGDAVKLTTLGELFVLLQAVAVAVFAYLEHRALGREHTSAARPRAATGI